MIQNRASQSLNTKKQGKRREQAATDKTQYPAKRIGESREEVADSKY